MPEEQATSAFKPYRTFNPVSPEWSGITYQDLVKPLFNGDEASVVEHISTTLTTVTTTFTFGAAAWFQDGTAAAPSIAFQNDTDSGWYRIGSDNVAATLGGTLKYDWNTTRLKLASAYKLYLGATTDIQENVTCLLVADTAVNDQVGWLMRNSNSTSGSSAFVGCANDNNNSLFLNINCSNGGGVIGSLANTSRAGVLYMGQTTASSAQNAALIIVNTFTDASSPIIFGIADAEVARFSAQTGRLGINTTTPARKLESLDASNPQLRLTHTAATDYLDVQVDTDGLAYFTPTGGYMELSGSSTTERGFGVFNTNNASGSAGGFIGVTVGGTSAGDAYFFVSDQTNLWSWGIDNSVGGNFVLANSGVLGTDNYVTVTTDGRFVVSYNATGTDPNTIGAFIANSAGTVLVGCTNDNSGSTSVAGFYAKCDGSTPRGVALIHTSSTFSDGGATASNEAVLNAEEETAGLRIRTTNGGSGYILFVTRDGTDSFRNVMRMSATPTLVINEDNLSALDVQINGASLTHMFFTDATGTTENIALLASGAPNWQSMDRGLFIGDRDTAPTGNPSSGFFHWSESGAPKWRDSSGNLFTLVKSSAYTPSNVTTDRSYDANAYTTDELADVLGTLIADLQAVGIIG